MLTDTFMSNLKPKDKEYKVWDMTCGPRGPDSVPGLFAVVPMVRNGRKWWRIKYRFNGKEQQLSLGIWPHISCCDARMLALEIKEQVASDIDPSKLRKEKVDVCVNSE